MSALIKDNSGEWKRMGVPFTRIGGTWRPCKQMWTKVDNQWKKVFDLELPDTFAGSGNLDGQLLPGNSVWKTYRGTWTKGSNTTTADAINSVAGIETGVSQNIRLEVDPSSSAQAGHGVAFWIQDQSNWWGAQTFYETFTFTNSPTSITYNHFCTSSPRQGSVVFVAGPVFVQGTLTVGLIATGTNFSEGTRNCRGDKTYGTVSFANGASGCGPSPCSPAGTGAGFGNPCNAPLFVKNCGTTCTNCSAPGPGINFSETLPSGSPCPAPAFGQGFISPTCANFFSFSYSCSSGGESFCSYAYVPPFTNFVTFSDQSFSNPVPTTPPCPNNVDIVCSAQQQTVTFPGNTVTNTSRRTRIIRSQLGVVSTVSGTTSPDTGGLIGSIETTLEPSNVRVRTYSGANRTGTAYPIQTYSIPSGTPKTTKHGIVVSGTPTSQGFAISRFKATLI